MSATHTMTIKFEGWDSFKKRTRAALKFRKPSIAPKDVLVFSSVADYQKFMTEQKLSILAVIVSQKPTSIYQLAGLVERDVANVQRDCVALESMGFIKLDDAKDAKKSKIPKLIFPYTKILIQMPKVSYCHDLNEAA